MVDKIIFADENELDDGTREMLSDVRDTLRCQFTPLALLALARFPVYLHAAWRELKPNVRSRQFSALAEDVRIRAMRGAGAAGKDKLVSLLSDLNRESLDYSHDAMNAFEFLYPRLYLALLPLRNALNPETKSVPKVSMIEGANPSEIKRMREAANYKPVFVSEREAGRQAGIIFEDIKYFLELPYVPEMYQSIANWPILLGESWGEMHNYVESDDYQKARVSIEEPAVAYSSNFAVNNSRAMLQLQGLDDESIEEIAFILDHFTFVLPGFALQTSYLLDAISKARNV